MDFAAGGLKTPSSYQLFSKAFVQICLFTCHKRFLLSFLGRDKCCGEEEDEEEYELHGSLNYSFEVVILILYCVAQDYSCVL